MRTLLVSVALLFATSASANGPERLEGTWRWLEDPAQAAAIERGVERAVQAFNFLIQPVVRMQLEPVAVAFPQVELDVTGQTVTFVDHLEAGVQRTTRTLGTRDVPGVTDDGEKMWATTVYDGGVLRRTERTARGGRTIAYRLTAERALEVAVRFFSDQLPEPLAYTLTYERR